MQIVLIATRWGSAEGGINAFNHSFAKGLAVVGRGTHDIVCAVEEASDADVETALRDGVRLLAVGETMGRDDACGGRIVECLRAAGASADVDLWIGHDVKTGFSAVAAASTFGGGVALIHHMAYESYRNLIGGQGEEAAARHDEQIDLFSARGAMLFGVGDDLRASAARLGATEAGRIVPGFPEGFVQNSAGSDELRVVVAGRFDAGSEPLKQSRLTAVGLGRAVRMARQLRPLARATLSVFGATEETICGAHLERLASDEAGITVNVLPAQFDGTRGVGRHLARANLLIMPSVREGFGLIGWEAIGCDVPLILGDQTGLHSFLDGTLGRADRWVHALPLTGRELDDRDIAALAEAIVDVAQDLSYARQRATELRRLLKAELGGCTWPGAAQEFLDACLARLSAKSDDHAAQRQRTAVPVAPSSMTFRATATNHRQLCAELELDGNVGQGSTERRFDVLATLRFGETELEVDGVDVSIGVRRALVHVTSEHGRLSGERLGEGSNAPDGIVANAGGVWELTPTGGPILKHKVLGDEVLCRVETPPNLPPHARVEVTAARRDIVCDFRSEEPLDRATESVMKIFLENALFEKASGHLVLSTADLREER